jgi:hypothetical protein
MSSRRTQQKFGRTAPELVALPPPRRISAVVACRVRSRRPSCRGRRRLESGDKRSPSRTNPKSASRFHTQAGEATWGQRRCNRSAAPGVSFLLCALSDISSHPSDAAERREGVMRAAGLSSGVEFRKRPHKPSWPDSFRPSTCPGRGRCGLPGRSPVMTAKNNRR